MPMGMGPGPHGGRGDFGMGGGMGMRGMGGRRMGGFGMGGPGMPPPPPPYRRGCCSGCLMPFVLIGALIALVVAFF